MNDTAKRPPSQIIVHSSLISNTLKRNVRAVRFHGHLTPSLVLDKKGSFLSGHANLSGKSFGLTYNHSPKITISSNKVEASYSSGGESDGASEPVPSSNHALKVETQAEPSMSKVKIGIYFATWWALNVVFNIYNKKVLNAYPYPWLTSTLSLAAGSLIMIVSWITGIVKAPDVDFDFWKALAPVSYINGWQCIVFYFRK